MTARTPKSIVFKTVDKKRHKENFLHPLESYYCILKPARKNSVMNASAKSLQLWNFKIGTAVPILKHVVAKFLNLNLLTNCKHRLINIRQLHETLFKEISTEY